VHRKFPNWRGRTSPGCHGARRRLLTSKCWSATHHRPPRRPTWPIASAGLSGPQRRAAIRLRSAGMLRPVAAPLGVRRSDACVRMGMRAATSRLDAMTTHGRLAPEAPERHAAVVNAPHRRPCPLHDSPPPSRPRTPPPRFTLGCILKSWNCTSMCFRAALAVGSFGFLGFLALLQAQRPFKEYPAIEYEDFPLPPDWKDQQHEWVRARLRYPDIFAYPDHSRLRLRPNRPWPGQWTMDYPHRTDTCWQVSAD
jgi:hypothetical protein